VTGAALFAAGQRRAWRHRLPVSLAVVGVAFAAVGGLLFVAGLAA
jgi:hypothetical protein